MGSPSGTSVNGSVWLPGFDLSVPLPLDDAPPTELERDGAEGSGGPAYAHGLALVRRG